MQWSSWQSHKQGATAPAIASGYRGDACETKLTCPSCVHRWHAYASHRDHFWQAESLALGCLRNHPERSPHLAMGAHVHLKHWLTGNFDDEGCLTNWV